MQEALGEGPGGGGFGRGTGKGFLFFTCQAENGSCLPSPIGCPRGAPAAKVQSTVPGPLVLQTTLE